MTTAKISTPRLWAMRALYLLTFLGLGSDVWPVLLDPDPGMDPLHGVAYSFWAAYATLMGLGLRYPLRMLPLILLQLVYKTIWLLCVALPLSRVGDAPDMTQGFIIAVVLDLLVIPWIHVWRTWVRPLIGRGSARPAPVPREDDSAR